MDGGELRFEVTKAKVNWRTYFQDLMKPRFGGAASPSLGFESYSGRGPSVVAVNPAGVRRVVLVAKTMQEARDQVAVVEREYRSLGPDAWCERYGIPRSFVSG